ncbi:hypothetical protein G6F57_023727 [Rhizopus arrhizus]|nr:hypothetical protein G6F57_023727 [Rhizopus arrhizus]
MEQAPAVQPGAPHGAAYRRQSTRQRRRLAGRGRHRRSDIQAAGAGIRAGLPRGGPGHWSVRDRFLL